MRKVVDDQELPPLTEALVQDIVFARCRKSQHDIVVPNCGSVWGVEADIASLTKTKFGHAFEIKVSRADWLAELRHIRGDCGCHAGRHKCAKNARASALFDAKELARKATKRENGRVPPNYFWVVAPPDVVKNYELPDFAGLLEVLPGHGQYTAHGYRLREIVGAPRLHGIKLSDHQIMAMARGAMLRYWSQRNPVLTK